MDQMQQHLLDSARTWGMPCWCGAEATVVNETTDAIDAHPACTEHAKDGYVSIEPDPELEGETAPYRLNPGDRVKVLWQGTGAHRTFGTVLRLREDYVDTGTGESGPVEPTLDTVVDVEVRPGVRVTAWAAYVVPVDE